MEGCVFAPSGAVDATAAMWVGEEVAIAAGDEAVGPAQDRPHLVAQVMVAPVARIDGVPRQECFGDLTVRGAALPGVERAQIEHMSVFCLLRQRSVWWACPPALQRPPEPAGGVEPRLEGLVERKNDRVDRSIDISICK